MNETLKTILSRRSIRNYKREQIKDEELHNILEAGRFAPSGMNKQPWHFTVVQNKEMLNKINQGCKVMMKKQDDENFSAFYNAPTLIIVSGDEKAVTPQCDCPLALENMFLASESLGIGSCWIHATKFLLESAEGTNLKKELGIPEGYNVFGSGAFGYKAIETPSPAPRKEGTVNIIK